MLALSFPNFLSTPTTWGFCWGTPLNAIEIGTKEGRFSPELMDFKLVGNITLVALKKFGICFGPSTRSEVSLTCVKEPGGVLQLT